MRRTTVIRILQWLWISLMAVLLVLVVTQSIGGFAMAIYGTVVLAVAIAEMALRGKLTE